jgi:hypothetical protein
MRWAIWPLAGAAVLACSRGDDGRARAGSGNDTTQLAGQEPTIRAVDTTLLTDPQGLGTDRRPAPVPMPPAGGAVVPGTAYPPPYPPPTYPSASTQLPPYPAPSAPVTADAPSRSADVPVVVSPPTPPQKRPRDVTEPAPMPAPEPTPPATQPAPQPAPQPSAPPPSAPPPSRDTTKPAPVTPTPTPPPPPPPDSLRTR